MQDGIPVAHLITQRVLRWQYFIKEYLPKISYVESDKNVLVDSISRCKRLVTEREFVDTPHLVPPSDEDSIDEIEGCFNVESEEFGPVLFWSSICTQTFLTC